MSDATVNIASVGGNLVGNEIIIPTKDGDLPLTATSIEESTGSSLLSRQYHIIVPLVIALYFSLEYGISTSKTICKTGDRQPFINLTHQIEIAAALCFAFSLLHNLAVGVLLKWDKSNEKLHHARDVHIAAATVNFIAGFSSIRSFTSNDTRICIDAFGVETYSSQWAEWIAVVPFLTYTAIAVEDKSQLDKKDIIFIALVGMAILCGFLMTHVEDRLFGYFVFFSGCICVIITLTEDIFQNKANKLKQLVMQKGEELTPQEIWACTRTCTKNRLSWLLLLFLPTFPGAHFLRALKVLDRNQLVIANAVLGLFSKLFFVGALAQDAVLVELSKEITSHESRRRFLRYVFHEVRVPLNTISMGLTVVRDDGIHLSSATHEAISMMEGAAKYMSSTLNDVLSMSKIEDGAMELDKQPFRVGRIISAAVGTLNIQAELKRIRVKVDFDCSRMATSIDARRLVLIGDSLRLQQVLINLLSNAIKYSPADSEVIVRISAKVVEEQNAIVALRRSLARLSLGATHPVASGTSTPGSVLGGVAGAACDASAGPGQENRSWPSSSSTALLRNRSASREDCGQSNSPSASSFGKSDILMPPNTFVEASAIEDTEELTAKAHKSNVVNAEETDSRVQFSEKTEDAEVEKGDEDNVSACGQEEEEGKVELTVMVCDKGIGISKKNMSKLFVPYSLLRPQDNPEGHGSGLGLVFSKQIIDLHGGKMRMESIEGKGSTFGFSITLPSLSRRQTFKESQTIPIHEVESSPFPPLMSPPTCWSPRPEKHLAFADPGVLPPPASECVSDDEHGSESKVKTRSLTSSSSSAGNTPATSFSQSCAPSTQASMAASTSGSPSGTSRKTCLSDVTKLLASTTIKANSATPGSSVELPVCGTPETIRGVGDTSSAVLVTSTPTYSFGTVLAPEPSSATSAAAPGAVDSRQKKLEALIVDDTASNRKMLQLLLTKREVQCGIACNGVEGVEAVRAASQNFDVIFMDYTMPEMNGAEATAAIRALGFKQLIVGITANALDDDVQRFMTAGVDHVFLKPFRDEQLRTFLTYIAEHGNSSSESARQTLAQLFSKKGVLSAGYTPLKSKN